MSLTASHDRLASLTREAENVFKNHILSYASEERWVIRRTESSMFRAEVIKLGRNKLLVHGDISPVIFAYYSGEGKEGILHWVARMKNSWGYAREKASIGMDNVGVTVYDADVASSDIQEYIDGILEENEEESCTDIVEELRSLKQKTDSRPPGYIWQEFYEINRSDPDFEPPGEVIAPRIVYAVYAVRKLVDLLAAQ